MRSNTKTSNIVISFIGLCTAVYLAWGKCPGYYALLPLIPASYGILNLFIDVVWSKDTMSSIFGVMFNSLMLLRAVIMPILLKLGDYETLLQVNIEKNMPKAILLFSYEMICEYILFAFIYRRRKNLADNEYDVQISYEYHYGAMLLLLFLGLAVCLILAPASLTFYRTIFGITQYDYTGFDSHSVFNEYATSFASKFGLVTFRYIASVCRLVIPALILYRLKKRNASRKKSIIAVMALIFVFDLLIVDDTIATSIVNALITLIFYNRLFSKPDAIRKYFVYAAFGVAAYFALRLSLTASMSHYTNVFVRISNMTQAYFLGTRNIAAGFNLYADTVREGFKYMAYEILRGIPYASTIFSMDSTSISTLFNSVNNCAGQIVPVISSGCLYFTPVFAPAYSMLFLSISYKNNVNVATEVKPLRLLSSITICVYALMGISMYSAEATWSFIICVGLAIRLLSFVFERKVRR